jgi:hypothetical protein
VLLNNLKQFDINIELYKNQVAIIFVGISKEIGDKFMTKSAWLSIKEFPMFVDLHRFLEKHYNKPQDWFLTNFIPTVCSALDRVSLAEFNKIYSEVYGQEKANQAIVETILWLVFVAKELKQERLPEIYSHIKIKDEFNAN